MCQVTNEEEEEKKVVVVVLQDIQMYISQLF